ncbi:MAG: hypothetical protein NC911_08085 [Candidatus Omnitrophica bacterium]|nr:hypothetical protein [Candidatus Omnitrophota bacterium]
MDIREFISLLERSQRRFHFLGDELTGVVILLDLEGRLFTVVGKEVVNRVNPEAFWTPSTAQRFVNPGGDVLWPAPEGSCLGYFYSRGKWGLPASLCQARYSLISSSQNSCKIAAEIDLINNSGIGLPTVFERIVFLEYVSGSVVVKQQETIRYVGRKPLGNNQFLLAPWTLGQFDSGPGSYASFPEIPEEDIRDFYQPSHSQRSLTSSGWKVLFDSHQRYQIGLTSKADWIEFFNPEKRLRVRRKAEPLSSGFHYLDIADRPAEQSPERFGTRYSIYSDPTGFMEIEAAGGCQKKIQSEDTLSLIVTTIYTCQLDRK